jgi:hypothetical protein
MCPLCNARRSSDKAYFNSISDDASYPSPPSEASASTSGHGLIPPQLEFPYSDSRTTALMSRSSSSSGGDHDDRPLTGHLSIPEESEESSGAVTGYYPPSISISDAFQHDHRHSFMYPPQGQVPGEHGYPAPYPPQDASDAPPPPPPGGQHPATSTAWTNQESYALTAWAPRAEEGSSTVAGPSSWIPLAESTSQAAPAAIRRSHRPPMLNLGSSSSQGYPDNYPLEGLIGYAAEQQQFNPPPSAPPYSSHHSEHAYSQQCLPSPAPTMASGSASAPPSATFPPTYHQSASRSLALDSLHHYHPPTPLSANFAGTSQSSLIAQQQQQHCPPPQAPGPPPSSGPHRHRDQRPRPTSHADMSQHIQSLLDNTHPDQEPPISHPDMFNQPALPGYRPY